MLVVDGRRLPQLSMIISIDVFIIFVLFEAGDHRFLMTKSLIIWDYYVSHTVLLMFSASFPNAFQSQTAQQLQAAANSPAGKQTEGKNFRDYFCFPFLHYHLQGPKEAFGTIYGAILGIKTTFIIPSKI